MKEKQKNKNNKSKKKNSQELFNFKDEIVIGINNPKVLQAKKQAEKDAKNNVKKSAKSKKTVVKKNNAKNNLKNKKKLVAKKNTKLKAFLKWAILLILLAGAIIYFMMSPLFNIKGIYVIGNEKVNSKLIANLSELQEGNNIYKFNKIKTIDKIKTNPYISDVKVSRVLPDKVKIEVSERTTTFLIELGNAYIYMDNQGYILEISEEKLELPLISSPTTEIEKIKPCDRLNNEDLTKLGNVIEIVSIAKTHNVYSKIDKIDIADVNNYTLYMKDSKIVYLGNASDLNIKIMRLKQVMENESGIEGEIFFEVNNRVVFREKV